MPEEILQPPQQQKPPGKESEMKPRPQADDPHYQESTANYL